MDTRYLTRQKKGGNWHVRIKTPKALSPPLPTAFYRSLGTTSLREAQEKRHRVVAEIKAEIAAERRNQESQDARQQADHLRELQDKAKELRELVRKGELDRELAADVGLDQILDDYLKRTQMPRSHRGDVQFPDSATESAVLTAASMVTDPESRLLSEVIADFLKELDERARNSTYQSTSRRLNEFLQWRGDVDVRKVTRADAGNFITKVLRPKGLAIRTLKDNVSAIGSAFVFARDRGWIETSPFNGLAKSLRASTRGVAPSRRPWLPDELERLLRGLQERQDSTLYSLTLLGMYSGCRINELCELKIADVLDDRLKITEGKSAAAIRDVPIHPAIAGLVKRLKDESGDEYLIEGLKRGGHDAIRSHAISKRFGRVKAELGFPKELVFHGLRASFTAALELAGVPESTADLLTGHVRPGMSYGRYSHGVPFETLQEAVHKVTYGSAVDAIAGEVK